MDIVFVFHVAAILPGFLDEMTAIRGRIDQNVIGTSFHTAFDDSLEEFIFQLVFLKRKVVDEDDVAVIAVFDGGDDFRKITELVLINFDHTKSRVVVFIDKRLDG